jgi:hypothetical protein
MERIRLDMSVLEILSVMSKGNPGAATVIISILDRGAKIDPDSFAGGLGAILLCDTLGLYEDRLYRLWKDVCKQSLLHTMAVLRACQLGLIARESINAAIDDRAPLDVEPLLAQVQEQLPAFGKETE